MMNTLKNTLLIVGVGACLSACFDSPLFSDSKESENTTSAQPVSQTTVAPEPVETPQNTNSTPTSLDLNVSSRFMFGNIQTVDFVIEAIDGHNNALNNRFISVFSIPENLTEWSDEHAINAHLIFKAKTDELGQLNRRIELPGNVSQVLLVLSYIGQKINK
jgi:hypothetical protein